MIPSMEKTELLAPAGDWSCLKTAVGDVLCSPDNVYDGPVLYDERGTGGCHTGRTNRCEW